MSTAAGLIIGDEILTGKCADKNSKALANMLFERGVSLQTIEVIPDNSDVIAEHAKALSEKYDYVFTSGGIGPTHDDRTYAALAGAFNSELAYHEPTILKLAKYLKERVPAVDLNEARMKMALLPRRAQVIEIENLWVPLVVLKNVYVLPGVPSLFAYMIDAVKHLFVGSPRTRSCIYTMRSEGDIADALSVIQDRFQSVAIGSYPQFDDATAKVMISVEGESPELVEKAADEVLHAIDGFK
jgi:molybdenum cofactor synthesis domain-containing protein